MKIIAFILLFITAITCDIHAIKLSSDVDVKLFTMEHDLRLIETVGMFHIFETVSRSPKHYDFIGDKNVLIHEKQKKKKKYKRFISRFNDPYYASEWHLENIGFGYAVEKHITGRGVKIAVVDDGVEYTHPDIKKNFNLADSWDFNTQHNHDPNPSSRNSNHGTSVYGVIASIPNNHICTVGIASGASVSAIKLIESSVYGYTEASALNYHSNVIDIYSNSWGNIDTGTDLNSMSQVSASIIKTNYEKGVIYVFAGGNGRYFHFIIL